VANGRGPGDVDTRQQSRRDDRFYAQDGARPDADRVRARIGVERSADLFLKHLALIRQPLALGQIVSRSLAIGLAFKHAPNQDTITEFRAGFGDEIAHGRR
jgi:hypothetical protein